MEHLAGRSVRGRRLPELGSAADVHLRRPRNDTRRRQRAQRRRLPKRDGPEKETITAPYPSGVAGTPGPLDGYCSSLGANPETGSPVSQPAGTTLPLSPYYFPDVVRNADGSLTGYFDYRPKDADEAITVARSTDNGEELDH